MCTYMTQLRPGHSRAVQVCSPSHVTLAGEHICRCGTLPPPHFPVIPSCPPCTSTSFPPSPVSCFLFCYISFSPSIVSFSCIFPPSLPSLLLFLCFSPVFHFLFPFLSPPLSLIMNATGELENTHTHAGPTLPSNTLVVAGLGCVCV